MSAIPEIIGATIKVDHRIEGAIEASLFIISQKSPRLKVINLSALANLDEVAYANKLQKWNAAHRFVKVIELADKICIEANHKYAESLKDVIASKEGEEKTIEVKSLTDEESEEFFRSIQDTFKVTVIPTEDAEAKKVVASARAKSPTNAPMRLNPEVARPVDQALANFTLGFSKIVNKILDKMQEANEEDRAQQKRVEERRRIEKEELNREIVKDDVLKSGIKADLVKAKEIEKKTIAATNGAPIAVTTAAPAA